MKTKLLQLYSSDSEVQAAVCFVTYLYTAVLNKVLFLPHFPSQRLLRYQLLFDDMLS